MYSTYLGEWRGTRSHIAIDSGGTAYLTGSTTSTDFPVVNPAQRNNAGGGRVCQPPERRWELPLLFSTYLGGSSGTVMYPEIGQAIALDTSGNAYVARMTRFVRLSRSSPRCKIPASAVRTLSSAKISSTGTIVYSTYLGGSGVDVANAIVVDAAGAAYVAGYTISTDLPVANGLQEHECGWIRCLSGALEPGRRRAAVYELLRRKRVGFGNVLALAGLSTLYVAGYTLSTNFPVLSAYQTGTFEGITGGFVAKIDFSGLPSSTVLQRFSDSQRQFQSRRQSGAACTRCTVSNGRAARPTAGTCYGIGDPFQPGLTLLSMAGTGWTCAGNACTRSDVLASGVELLPDPQQRSDEYHLNVTPSPVRQSGKRHRWRMIACRQLDRLYRCQRQ